MKRTKAKPKFVIISDIHFNVNTLDLASESLRLAIEKAAILGIPLVIAGDLNDTKAIIRAEVANRLITLIKDCPIQVYVLIGNHDLINEKGSEHSLHFLAKYVRLVDSPGYFDELGAYLIPYQSTTEALESIVNSIPPGTLTIMHQGVLGAFMGEYIIDKSSISSDKLSHLTVYSGHYHRHQKVDTVTFIGTPYSVTYAEANDGPKGFVIIYDNNSFEQIPTNLRKHVIVTRSIDELSLPISDLNINDLLWLKVTGPKSELSKLNRNNVKNALGIQGSFKLDLIYEDSLAFTSTDDSSDGSHQYTILDQLIDNLKESDSYKKSLKELWRELVK